MLRAVLHVAAQQLLPFYVRRVAFVVLFAGLHTDIHKEDGRPQRNLRHVIVVPHRLHGLVGLCAIFVVGTSAIDVIAVLVVAKDGMRLVSVSLVAHAQHVVRQCRHGPVIRTQNALVVVRQLLAAYLHEESLGG